MNHPFPAQALLSAADVLADLPELRGDAQAALDELVDAGCVDDKRKAPAKSAPAPSKKAPPRVASRLDKSSKLRPDQPRSAAAAPAHLLELTKRGRAELLSEIDVLDARRNATAQERPWGSLAARVAAARAGAPLVARAIADDALRTNRARVALADDLLRQAADAATEANHTIRALEKPMGEVSKRAWALHQAFDTLADETNRDFYDRPCRPVFGACCVRDAPDGGMRITCGNGG